MTASLERSGSSIALTALEAKRLEGLGGKSFPDSAELLPYWGMLRRVTEILEAHNPADKYFSTVRVRETLDKGYLNQKDLFALWVSIYKHPKMILEIGSRTGKSLSTLLFVHPDPGETTAFLIDPFIEMGSPDLIKRNLGHLGILQDHVHAFVGFSAEVFPKLMETFPQVRYDYILVDGSHRREDALKDLQMVTPYVGPGGYVVMDDIGSYGPGVGYGLIDVWTEWKAEFKGQFECREYLEPWGFAAALKIKPK